MTPNLERDIYASKRIKKKIHNDDYALALYTVITQYKLAKKSFWLPFIKRDITNYTKRQASVIVSNLRGEGFKEWYFDTELSEVILKAVIRDLKRSRWVIRE